ncbi:amidohydrolase family protein [Pseudazoarcus pumilus]|nr:amidohydrolase family protein [Pseudazoarcus pumilus]
MSKLIPILCWASLIIGAPVFATPMLDAHSHYTADNAEALSPQQVVAALDAANVSHLVVSGTPWDAVLSLHEHAPDRVVPLLGVYASHLGKAMWMHDADLPARVEARLAEGEWAGIGELHLFARDAGSPVFAALVRLADAHGLMLLIHGDAEVIDRAFEIAPGLRVLWAHLGTVPTPGLVGRTLERHAGRALWVDTSVRDERIAPDGQLLPEWRALFEAHPERFVVAVDTFSTNRWRNYGEVVASIRGWTADLSPELRERMLWRNAEALFAPWLRGRP